MPACVAGEAFARRLRLIAALAVSLCCFAFSAHADVISDWNEAAVAAGYKAQLTPVPSTRNIALMHVAMFDVVNAITPRYQAYRQPSPPLTGVGAELAAAAAARAVLVAVYPEQSAVFDVLYEKSKARVQIDSAPSEVYGGTIAKSLLAERASDNVDMQETFRPDTRPGVYLPTPIPVGSTCAAVMAWTLKDAKQFRPPPPYRLTGADYARDLNEVASFGGRRGAAAKIARSKVFDNATSCSSENAVIIHDGIYDRMMAALAQAGAEGDFPYCSTAGGAFLEWLEGRELAGVKALEQT